MARANRGYVGWSMSKRAVKAYRAGEKPKSKWDKSEIFAAIDDVIDAFDLSPTEQAMEYIRKQTRDELFRKFFHKTSWHHTSKCFNVTDFYAIDADEVRRWFEEPSAWRYKIVYITEKASDIDERSFKTYSRAENALVREGFSKPQCHYYKIESCHITGAVIIPEAMPFA